MVAIEFPHAIGYFMSAPGNPLPSPARSRLLLFLCRGIVRMDTGEGDAWREPARAGWIAFAERPDSSQCERDRARSICRKARAPNTVRPIANRR
jgi:hypothetical protein